MPHHPDTSFAADRTAFYWLLVIALGVIGAGIGLRDPWPADEPRFALVAKDMVDSGRWFFPRVAGVLYPDKPPVYFWILGAFYSLTGSIRAAFLLPSLCAALLTLVLVYDLARRLWDRTAGWWAAGALLVCIQFLLFAKSARIDATLMMLVTLGMYGILRHLLLGPDWKWYLAGFAASGLGVITKGVGFLPLLVFLAYPPIRWLNAGRLPRFFARWGHWSTGPVALLGVIALWLVPMLWLVAAGDDPALAAYRDNILFKQTGERYADPWHHVEAPWYYLVEVIPLFWFPLSLALIWLIPAWLPAIRERDARLLLPLAWVVLVILFFSISPAKRGTYLLPALPMLALCAGPFLPAVVAKRPVRHTSLVVLVAMTLFLVGLLLWVEFSGHPRIEKFADRYELTDEVVWLLGAFAATALACLVAAWRCNAVAGLAAWLAGFWVIFGLVGYPLLNEARTPADIMRKAEQAVGDGELGMVGWKEQHVLFADGPAVHFGYRRRDWHGEVRDGLVWLLGGENRYLLMTDKFPAECVDLAGAAKLGYRHRQNWYLVAPDNVVEGCRPGLEKNGRIEMMFRANTKGG